MTQGEARQEAQRLNREEGRAAGHKFFSAGQDHYWVEVATSRGWTVERRRVTGRKLKLRDILVPVLGGGFSPSSRQRTAREPEDSGRSHEN